jgi:polyisoprenoid-binding protein YceI
MFKKFSTVVAISLTIASTQVSAQSFTADAKSSSIEWLAKKVTGQHNGDIKLNSGSITLGKNAITAGQFEVDMTSITVKDLTGEWNEKLLGHLKSDDFFATDKFEKATLVITEGKKASDGVYSVKGNLTIKGITKPISFPATVVVVGNNLTATSLVTIDRTLYDIKYGSKSFFEGIGDKAIDNEFVLTIKLVAKK